ncbi:MAG: sensor histidine kinase [Pseudomonadota bacterium]
MTDKRLVSADERAPGLILGAFCRVEIYLAAILAGEGVAILLALAPGDVGDRWVRLGLASLFIQWVVLCWVALLCLARGWLAGWPPQRVAWVAVLALPLVSLLVALVAHGLLSDFGVPLGPLPLFLLHVATMAWVVGLMGVLGFYAWWHARGQALRAKEAELVALHARMRPHFLFNTLNAIASLIPSRPAQAERMVEQLAGMLRVTLLGPREVDLSEELDLARSYLAIEAMRLEERLRVTWKLPEPLPELRVPSLSIQPLVENAVRYGVEPSRAGGEILIAVEPASSGWVILVRNSIAPGATGRTPATGGHGMALDNLRARLAGLSGGEGRLEVERGPDVFEARLSLPVA